MHCTLYRRAREQTTLVRRVVGALTTAQWEETERPDRPHNLPGNHTIHDEEKLVHAFEQTAPSQQQRDFFFYLNRKKKKYREGKGRQTAGEPRAIDLSVTFGSVCTHCDAATQRKRD